MGKKDISIIAGGLIIITSAFGLLQLPVEMESPKLRKVENIELRKIEDKILAKTGWERSAPGQAGFSGLVVDTVEEEGEEVLRLEIIWTDDGFNGYTLTKFSLDEKNSVNQALKEYAND